MQTPLQVNFHGFPPSDAVNDKIQQYVDQLEKLYGNITDCVVKLEKHHNRHRKGNIYHVCIDINVPSKHLTVNREPGKDKSHADLYLAIHDAFDAMKRVLQDYSRKRRREIKQPAMDQLTSGRIARIFPYDGYGFIQTLDDREIYFHENSVLEGTFSDLKEGDKVSFCEKLGEKGPQASTVHVRKHKRANELNQTA